MPTLTRPTISRALTASLHLLLGLALAACGGGGDGAASGDTGSTTDGAATPGGDATTPAEGVVADTAPAGPTPIDNDAFKILYTYEERLESCGGDPAVKESDLHIMFPDGSNGLAITQLSLKTEGVTCQFGCFTDREMRWIAVGQPLGADGTFRFVLGRFDNSLEAKIVKGFELEQVIDFGFGGPYMYFSRFEGQAAGAAGGRTYSISRVPLDANLVKQDVLPEIPPTPEDRSGSTYQGHFSVDASGRNLVYLNPTIGSQQVVHWNEVLTDFQKICPNEVDGNCITAGSQFTDQDPIAIDPNGERLVTVHQTDDALTAYRWELTRKEPFPTQLLKVPGGSTYETAACFNATAVFPWVKVRQARITPDGQDLLLLVVNDCASVEKEETDIIAIPLDAIGDGTPLEPGDVRNITKNPKGDVAANVIIHEFDISPAGDAIVFVGSPMVNQDGFELRPGESRSFNDREVYVAPIDGTDRKQLTNELCFRARGVGAVLPAGTPSAWR